MSKPSIPQGTRDFSPAEVRKRQYIFNTLRGIFELYGFQPLETPAMEKLSTLMGKYGEEGDRLLFRILDNGNPYSSDFFEKLIKAIEDFNAEVKVNSRATEGPFDGLTMLQIGPAILADFADNLPNNGNNLAKLKTEVASRALRYDLTIPFARYVVMHHHEIAFPFRRYQMQPVWRGDKPQRGRYREFWQCDADVVGSTSLINEAELLCIYQSAFQQLGLPQVAIKINSRKLLAGLAEICGTPELMMEITIALDKLDKIGWDGVVKELKERGIADAGIAQIEKVINVQGSNDEKLEALSAIMANSATGLEGIRELRQTLAYHQQIKNQGWGWDAVIEVDISLARGLNYYTGVIVEVVCRAVKMGSIGGGGRYDDLTGLFGLKNLSGVGVSFGIDRIYDVMEELNLFPQTLATGANVMIANFGGENEAYALQLLKQLRAHNIAAEIYPESAKFDKQMKYANKRGIAYVLLPGDDERAQNKVSVKNFITGEQQLLDIDAVVALLK